MATSKTTRFLAGVIEGFYGSPWTPAERFELFDWMTGWGLNTYLYAPKDDLKHRTLWREPYSASEAEKPGELIRACQQHDIRFIYALSPGLDIRYSDEAELNHLRNRFEQMLALGCQDFSLLFDDIPDRMDTRDIKRWGSLASAQSHVANALFKWTRERCPAARFLFCPTPYCGRMAERKLGGEGYLAIIGRELLPEIDVFWTGPEIISREITAAHVQELRTILRRKPLIWDNLHANDYDGRRFYCGPYAGRPPELRDAVAGLLTNPNCEFPLNYVPLRTLAEFTRCEGLWDARKAYLSAMREWLSRFATVGEPVTLEDLILFGDCYYLPHAEGPEAEALYESAGSLLAKKPVEWNPDQITAFRKTATRLHELCVRMPELRHRPLFHALSRRVWELREELDLLLQYVAGRGDGGAEAPSLTSHLPGTYRGGMVARLQRLLVQQRDGTFAPAGSDVGPAQ
ncbi:MAG TPA: beta-N-acetylglucosaminidase domain-containing protein [Verrucomicrobiae bacterium]|nr:beta-N-acetylglucosaminidase domain-containing protein [Verrucomicrobiae bacterium]